MWRHRGGHILKFWKFGLDNRIPHAKISFQTIFLKWIFIYIKFPFQRYQIYIWILYFFSPLWRVRVTGNLNKKGGEKQPFLAGFFQFFNKRGLRLFGTLELETMRCLLTSGVNYNDLRMHIYPVAGIVTPSRDNPPLNIKGPTPLEIFFQGDIRI